MIRTGEVAWVFHTIPHPGEFGYMSPSPAPTELLTVQHDGKSVDIVAQVTKQGFVFVFDQMTGKPLWPIDERPAPATDMPGEEVWPTQPYPVKPPPFARQKFTADDVNSFITDPAERARIRDEIQSARNEGLFTPPHPLPLRLRAWFTTAADTAT